MTYYDETFEPWEIVDGQCVVADEAEWKKIDHVVDGYFEKVHLHNPGGAKIGEPPKRPIVKLTTDVFHSQLMEVENSSGGLLSWCYNECPVGEWNDCFCPDCGAEGFVLTTEDLLARVFRNIDATPNVDYLMPTLHPELIRESWSLIDETGPRAKWVGFQQRPNVILATYVETQADIERLVPELLKCHDLCAGLAVVCNPKEALNFNFKPLLGNPEGYTNFAIEYLDLVIAEGNEHPMHPDWLRSLRDQALEANVKFNLASWGEWLHMSQFPTGTNDLVGIETTGPMHSFHAKVGKERSGRLLDGQEHNGGEA